MGCSAGGLVATYATAGRSGVRRLLGQAVHVKVPVLWWLYVLIVPVAMQTCVALVSFASAGVTVAIRPAALLSLATPPLLLPFLFGPFGEEFGWRGFLLPHLVRRLSVLPACLIVGVIEALWHWPLEYQQMAGLVWYAACGSFMIAAVYLRANSVLLAMVMHWNFNSMAQLSPKLFPGVPAADISVVGLLGVMGVLALFAALTIPTLLAAQRAEGLSSLGRSGQLDRAAAGD